MKEVRAGTAFGCRMGYPDSVEGVRLNEKARERVAERFRALGEPMRLRILERLFRSPASVGEVLADVGGTQANVSKHLSILRSTGAVRRRRAGMRTVYSIADPTLEKICAIVCGAVEREARDDAEAIGAPASRRRRARATG